MAEDEAERLLALGGGFQRVHRTPHMVLSQIITASAVYVFVGEEDLSIYSSPCGAA